MARNDDHYAIVIGLARYPCLGEPPPSDLRGPVNDALAVRDWLIEPDGGGLPDANVAIITSPEPAPPAGGPERDEIQKAFLNLARQAEAKRNALGALLGRRLYVYVSGHGFSPSLNQGCLLAGNAGGIAQGANVWVTRWLEQFQDAGYFFETVLWMDCCMNRDARDEASLPTMKPRISATPPGPGFAAVAARRPLRAVEQENPKGKFHGVFTTALLEGLRGAAVNPYGMVTGRSLADWLRNAQRARLSTEDLEDPRVSKEPDVFKEDQSLIFKRGLKPRTYPVELQIGGGKGKTWRLWSDRPVKAEEGKVPASSRIKLDLRPGLYAIEVPDLSLRQGFEVTGPLKLEVDQEGPPVSIGTDLVTIEVSPEDPTAEIYLVDNAFQLVDRDIGKLTARVPPGVYKTRIRSADRLAEQVYLLDETPKRAEAVPELPAFEAPAPLAGTAFTHEYHEDALQSIAAEAAVPVGAGSQILLMARLWRPDDSVPAVLPQSAALELWSSDEKIADLVTQGRVSDFRDPYSLILVDLDPGTYFIRRTVSPEASAAGLEPSVVEQAILALPGWRTSYFLLETPDPNVPADSAQPRIGMLMHRIGAPFDPARDRLLLQAETAVGKNRAALTKDLEELLVRDPPSPLAAILGGHLLIIEQQKRPSVRFERLRPLVDNLRQTLDPIASGDVDALAVIASSPDDPLVHQLGAPPMFKASWDLLADASLKQPDLVPAEIFSRMLASSAAPPFSAWATDRRTREASIARLKETFAPEIAEREAVKARALADIMRTLDITGRGLPGGASADLVATSAAEALEPGRVDWIETATDAGSPTAAGAGLSGEAAAKLKALGLPASALDL